MEPIINPLLFYLISIADNVKELGTFLVVIPIIANIIFFLFGTIFLDDLDCNGVTLPIGKIIIKISIPLVITGTLLSTFIPSKECCYQMLVASAVTQDNIDYVQGKATNLIDYIVEQIDKMIDEEN